MISGLKCPPQIFLDWPITRYSNNLIQSAVLTLEPTESKMKYLDYKLFEYYVNNCLLTNSVWSRTIPSSAAHCSSRGAVLILFFNPTSRRRRHLGTLRLTLGCDSATGGAVSLSLSSISTRSSLSNEQSQFKKLKSQINLYLMKIAIA